MKFQTKRLVFGACMLAALVFGAAMYSAGEQSNASKADNLYPDTAWLVPIKLVERPQSYTKFITERQRTIDALLRVVQEKQETADMISPSGQITYGKTAMTYPEGRIAYAIRMLGDLRAPKAVQALLDIIDFQFTVTGMARLEPPKDAQVIQALIQIGKPASTGAVEYLANDKSSKRAPMYVRVIAQVEGIELGKVMVRLAADKEKDPEKKARLEAAIGLFDKAGEPIP